MSRSELDEDRAYLDRSLEDLEREHAAGDLAGADYERLRTRYERLRADLERKLGTAAAADDAAAGASGPGDEEPAGRRAPAASRLSSRLASRRARALTGWSAFAFLAAAATVLGLALGGVGPFASQPKLSVEARVQIMLAEASVLGSNGHVGEALSTYDKVLSLQPSQPEALAGSGWLSRLAGLADHSRSLLREGDVEIQAAVRADPDYATARAYDGVMLYQDRHDALAASAQFRAMVSDHASQALLRDVRRVALAAFKGAHEAVPSPIARARSG